MIVPAVVVVTPEQLTALIRSAVDAALAEQNESANPVLLDRAGLAQRLGIGVATVDRLRRDGMPCVHVGDSPRFELAICLAWLRERDGKNGCAGELR